MWPFPSYVILGNPKVSYTIAVSSSLKYKGGANETSPPSINIWDSKLIWIWAQVFVWLTTSISKDSDQWVFIRQCIPSQLLCSEPFSQQRTEPILRNGVFSWSSDFCLYLPTLGDWVFCWLWGWSLTASTHNTPSNSYNLNIGHNTNIHITSHPLNLST